MPLRAGSIEVGVASVTFLGADSFQTRQIGRNRTQFFRIERYHRHVVAGLECLRIGDPCRKRAAGGLEESGPDVFSSADVGEIRTGGAGAGVPRIM